MQKHDLRLAAWTRRGFDTRERNPEIVAERLLRDLAPCDILLLHDGDAAITDDGQPVLLSVLPRIFDAAKNKGCASLPYGKHSDLAAEQGVKRVRQYVQSRHQVRDVTHCTKPSGAPIRSRC